MSVGKLQRLLALTAIMSVACSTYAVAPGFYMGIMAGPATNNAGTVQAKTLSGTPPTTTVSPKSNQFGSHMYLGYKGNQYAAAEFGFTYFSTIVYDNKGVETCSGTEARARDLDAVLKLSYPYAGFEPYIKAGAAIVYSMTSGGLNSSATSCGKTQYSNQVKPTYSLGVGYDLSQNWVADISFNRLIVPGSISSMTYLGLGISYHFVDKYCGQFLCDD
jgi:opacity protein-like surface antigen